MTGRFPGRGLNKVYGWLLCLRESQKPLQAGGWALSAYIILPGDRQNIPCAPCKTGYTYESLNFLRVELLGSRKPRKTP